MTDKCHDCDVECESVKLRRERDELRQAAIDGSADEAMLHDEVLQLTAQNERLREALEHYTDSVRVASRSYQTDEDDGAIARAALAESPAQSLAAHNAAARAATYGHAAQVAIQVGIGAGDMRTCAMIADLLRTAAAEAARGGEDDHE